MPSLETTHEETEQPPKTDKRDKAFDRAFTRIGDAQSKSRDERMQCLQDRRFYSVAGAQWEGPLGEQFANKPKFEMNKVHLAVIRIINEYRNNRIAVLYTSKDGTTNDALPETCNGLYRADERDSGAQEAFDNAFEEAVGGGFGALRLSTRYENEYDDEDTRQRITFEAITDADSCVFFGDSKRQDKRDATWACVLTGMSTEAYKYEYNDDPVSWDREIQQSQFDWCTADEVYVAEYYEVEEKSELVHFFRGIALGPEDPGELRVTAEELAEEGKAEELKARGFREVRKKRIKCRKIHKYILSGGGILEDEGFIAGDRIPIIPVFGKRWVVDGIERCMGHVRLAKDAQMLTNMLMSWLAEMAARFDMEKPILTPEQIAGHATMWSNDNVEKFPYLLINPILDPATGQKMPMPPVGYTKAPQIPPVMGALMQIAEQALQDLLGNQQAGEEVQPNISGKVVELIQNRLDMQVFIYMSNMAKAVQCAGEVWLGMARDVYIEEKRRMKVLSTDGKPGSVELHRPMEDEATGATVRENDLTKADFDVVADVGPSSTSRRASTVRALSALLQSTQDQETRAVLEGMIMLNMEGEGLQDVRDYYRGKLVRMGVVKPTEEEKESMAKEQENAQPDANAQYLQAAAMKQEADAQGALAKIGETHAKTLATLAGIESSQLADTIALADALTPGPITDAPPAAAEAAPMDAPADMGAPQQ